VRRGGTLLLGSAAALTLGTHTVPVYEVYKVGAEPRWAEGLDLLGDLTGLRAAVIPHYDNNEGGTHDTRFCYLGEQRLTMLEADLPAEVGILGVDEHTAAVMDLDAGELRVLGNGVVSVRRDGATQAFAAGSVVPLAEVAALLRGESVTAVPAARPAPRDAGAVPEGGAGAAPEGDADAPVPSLRAEAERARSAFDAAVAARDADGCVAAVLRLESAIADWSADTLQSDDADEARRVLRALVTRLGDLSADGLRDPRSVVEPYVEALLSARASARAAGDYAASDAVRDRLVVLGVEVRDTPEGTSWELNRV
jgi:hypothetical protein